MTVMSFKELRRQEVIKRADAMKIRYKDLYIEAGFNERERTEDFVASVNELADYIYSGGTYPPLEVRVSDEGKVFVVDGHRRHEAIGIAIERGAPIDWIEIRQFTGNNADRVARIVTSAQGRPLSPLETSRVYKRLAAFGLSASEIASKVCRSVQHVNELLTLASADTDVQKLVSEKVVSAKNAAQAVRQHGEKAGEVLSEHLQAAQAVGKTRVTASTMKTATAAPAPEPEPALEAAPPASALPAWGKLLPISATDEMVSAGRTAVRRFQQSEECRMMAEPEAMAEAARLCYAAMAATFESPQEP